MTIRPKTFIGAVLAAGLIIPLEARNSPSLQVDNAGWNLLRQIVLVPGVSGQEGPVMDWIFSRLPQGVRGQRDAKGNVWFTAGTGRPHILLVAHADELGFAVDAIRPGGEVRLKGRGGLLPQTCEARPFLILTPQNPVPGIMIPRPDYDAAKPQPFAPDAYELDVGAASEAEVRALGVAEGQPVIFKKTIIDLGPGLMAVRAVDDRAGCAALLAAARRTDWAALRGRSITCAWSVEEETGLLGAAALARSLHPDAVFAIDTFVSTDSPLENKRFGLARMGGGAVLRALDSSNLVPKPALARVLALAGARGIPVQVANSRGGNDGSVFVAGGAVDIPLAWPGAYAHSFIEKIDRRDLAALTALIAAVIEAY